MKILIAHSSGFDYRTELYEPLKNSSLVSEHQVIFPHDPENAEIPTKEQLKDADLMIAEVSYPSTGEGIEIGLAEAAGVPLLFLYKTGTKPSSSLRLVNGTLKEYANTNELVALICEHLALSPS